MKQNLICHNNTGKHDKIYMSCIKIDSIGRCIVIGKWGPRKGEKLRSHIKLKTYNQSAATAEQYAIFEKKLKEGYVSIESPAYSGNVSLITTIIKENLEGWYSVSNPREVKKKPEPKIVPAEPVSKEIIVICLNSTGIENQFDQDIEYVGETHPDKSMLWVYDKIGEKREVFNARFKKVKE